MINNYNFGADPELFIIDKSNNEIISAEPYIKGFKHSPFVPEGFPKGFGTEIDNILAEFNIPVSYNKKNFLNNINIMKDYIRKHIQTFNPSFDIHCSSSELVNPKYLTSENANTFGCDIDFNAYTEEPNVKPENVGNLRSAGFHIHIGYNNPNVNDSLNLVKKLDFVLGLVSTVIDRDTTRRKLYGKAGSFRLTDYGVEYRVLGGKFLEKDEYINLAFECCLQSIYLCNTIGYKSIISDSNIQSIINNSNHSIAYKIIQDYKQYFNTTILNSLSKIKKECAELQVL